jgi:hypothetical protein
MKSVKLSGTEEGIFERKKLMNLNQTVRTKISKTITGA